MIITSKIRKYAWITLLLYALVLIWVIGLKCNMRVAVTDAIIGMRRIDLHERIILSLGRFAHTSPADAIINVGLFVPMGMLLPAIISKRPYLTSGLICFFVSLGFEVFQLISCIGGFTYIDIICNFLGAFLGCSIHSLLREKLNEKSVCRALAIADLLCGAIVIFAIINTIINIDIYFV